MHLVRRAATGAFALSTAFAIAACSPQDSGNNTLTQTKSLAPSSTAAVAPGGGSGTVDVEAKDNEFAPNALTAKAGDITIDVKNVGAAPHTFTSTDLSADQNVDAGKETQIKLTGVKPGTYKFVCKYHESLGMVGQLTVT